MKKKQWIIALTSLLLISCTGMKIQPNAKSSFEKFSQTPWIEVKEALKVSPTNARAYLQNGKQISPSQLNLYQTNCEIEVNKVLDIEQIIYPGRYEITHISTREGPVVFLKHSKVQYAMGGGRSSIDIKRTWRFKLQSQQYPNVLFMHCRGVQDNEFQAELPTIAEIRQAVGHIIDVHLTLNNP